MTQSTTDELLELCEQVYEKTGWKPTDITIPQAGADVWSGKPLYTSDYLLEKLTEVRYNLRIEHNHSDMTWYAYYAGKSLDNERDWSRGSGTPLGALLKLTLNLNEEKLL